MRGQIMLKKIFFFLKLTLFPVLGWPQSKDATRLKMTCVKLYQCFCIILAIGLLLSLIYAITIHFNDFLILVELILGVSAMLHSIGNFISHIIYDHHIQVIAIYVQLT